MIDKVTSLVTEYAKILTRRVIHMPGLRRWVKLWVSECLEGSIRYQLEAGERGVWYDLILISSLGGVPGTISDRDKRAFPHSFIASRLNIPIDLLELTLDKCITEGRCTEDEHGIHITNWDRYQSEYQRQAKYRKSKDEVDPDKFIKGKYGHVVDR